MSQIPISSAMTLAEPLGFPDPFSGLPGWVARYGDEEVSQFRRAELIAEKWNISRDDMEAFPVESHERALRARAEGRFEAEIVALMTTLLKDWSAPAGGTGCRPCARAVARPT